MTPTEYATASVKSRDGTTIGYRVLGQGPGVVLLHGGMMASQNLMKLAHGLEAVFRVHVPDRRGRGRSGTFGDNHGLRTEVEDLEALLGATGSHFVFGLSAGAVIAVQAALTLPAIHKVALYEPPLTFRDSSSVAWVPRYEREMALGKLAAAFVTIAKGTGDSTLLGLVPRLLLVPLMTLALDEDAKKVPNGDVALKDLVPTMHHDARLVIESEGSLDRFRDLEAKVLLMGGAKSARYLHIALDRLGTVLPRAERVELAGVGHLAADNGGQPARVAAELKRFFS